MKETKSINLTFSMNEFRKLSKAKEQEGEGMNWEEFILYLIE
jgi:hypothetical protein